MNNDQHLAFMREKILNIGSALFFSVSNAFAKLPVSIVNILDVNDAGECWFFIKRPVQTGNILSKDFFSELRLYRKGRNYCITLHGRASLMENENDIKKLISFSDRDIKKILQKLVLVKIKIQKLEYYEPGERATSNWWESLKYFFSKLLIRQKPTFASFIIQDPAIAIAEYSWR